MYLVRQCSQTEERTGLHWSLFPMHSIMLSTCKCLVSTCMYLVRQCSQREEMTGLHWTPVPMCSVMLSTSMLPGENMYVPGEAV